MSSVITACMIVKNEDRFVLYSIASVIGFVDRFIIFDTGSSDNTVKIIKGIKSPKIIFRQKSAGSGGKLAVLRQEQADLVKNGWVWIVDADEVYPEKTSEKIVNRVQSGNSLTGIIVHRYDLLGDIYHCQDESVGSYNQFGKTGHYVLRLINKDNIGKLEVKGSYPNEYFAENGK